MRDIAPALAGHMAEGATTLCHCWKLLRRDGVVLGFTDHDRDLVFAGVTFAACSGLEPSEISAELGFAVATSEVAGALSALSLTEADIVSGLYDDATVETWLVNWADPEGQRLLLDVASIGEIKRTDHAFLAELRGIMHRLDQPQGRLYSLACAADLGDARCGIDLTLPAFCAEGSVAATDGRLLVQAGDLGDMPTAGLPAVGWSGRPERMPAPPQWRSNTTGAMGTSTCSPCGKRPPRPLARATPSP